MATITPLAMSLLTGGTAAFAMGLAVTFYKFYAEKKDKVLGVEDVLLWSGGIMIAASLAMAFL